MRITTEEQIATVLALRPSRRSRANNRRAPVVLRAPARSEITENVVDLERARRRLTFVDIEPQGGDAA